MKTGTQLVDLDYQNVKFSLLAQSLRQQFVLVLCFYRVMETRFLTNDRAYFLGLFF